jgi:hypothetical protein
MIYQQVLSILTMPPGNLVYHLVLAFSIAGALPGALNLWQRDGLEAGRRMVIGLGLLLAAQFTLILDAGLAQFFPVFADWLPVLDRAVNAISLVILIWLWVFPLRSSRADTASLIIAVLVLLLTVLCGLWWLNQTDLTYFNGTSADLLWAGFSLVLALTGGILLIIRHPEGYGIGLAMFTLLFLGQFVYLVNPLPQGDYPGFVRITQIAAYPLLLTLPARYGFGGEIESQPTVRATFHNFQTIATSAEPQEVYQSITAIVSQAMKADLCLLISAPDANKNITLFSGFDLIHQEQIGPTTFESKLVPVLSESLRQARPLHLPAEGNIPDLEGLEKILGIPITGALLSTPILTASGEFDRSLVLLTPESDRSWTAADQNYLADIAASLSNMLNYKNEYQANADQLAHSNKTLGNIQDENDRLNDELIELTSRYNSSEGKIEQLQIELRRVMDEIDLKETSQPQEKGLPE